MTTLNEARGAVYSAFVVGWGATSPITFDNENFDPPAGVWARMVVRHAGRDQESLGGLGARKFESVGSVIVQCFGPLDTGTALVDTLAQVAQGIFEGKTLTPEGIRFTSAVVTEIGPTEDWMQVNVESLFSYTQLK